MTAYWPQYIYLLRVGREVKVGISKDPRNRARTIQTGRTDEVRVLAVFVGNAADEQRLHEEWRPFHVQGEWFAPTIDAVRTIVRRAGTENAYLVRWWNRQLSRAFRIRKALGRPTRRGERAGRA